MIYSEKRLRRVGKGALAPCPPKPVGVFGWHGPSNQGYKPTQRERQYTLTNNLRGWTIGTLQTRRSAHFCRRCMMAFGAIALDEIRRHAIRIAATGFTFVRITVIAIIVLGAPFGGQIVRAEQNPSASGAAGTPFSGAVAPFSGILPVVVNIPAGVTSP